MSLWEELAEIHAEVSRENAARYQRWWDSLSPEERAEKRQAEIDWLRQWDAMTADQKADIVHRKLAGQL